MKITRLIGERFKERPSDAVIESHSLMLRGGYMKQVTNGVYSSFYPLKRMTDKVENIIRQEMDRIDGQEVLFPVVMPASLWKESGRYDAIGKELLRFTDRYDQELVLGMTHEEAAVHLVREYGNTYTRYPFMIYQIQTKFRDEARPRAGLIRVREFTMKDGYSFHTTGEDLSDYYDRTYEAYERIFARCGIPEVISVESDPGMMGGNISHEFMLLCDAGEDTIVLCNECDYRSNMEAATSIVSPIRDKVSEDLKLVDTPNLTTIEEVTGFLNLQVERACKAVVYRKFEDDSLVLVFIRGDYELNETKLRNILKADIYPATIEEEDNICGGFIGPIGLPRDLTVLFDISLEGANNLVIGANEEDKHYTGFDMDRDLKNIKFHDLSKVREGDTCPVCKKDSIHLSRGIEVGNIFQLGTRYSESMGMEYLDKEGKSKYPLMGCYGIGVGRLVASVCEAHRDQHGPIWPMAISPWQVHLCAIRADEEGVGEYANKLYDSLLNKGIEVIFDDRNVRPGVMFSDADLLGVPIRLIVSPRNLEAGIVEIVARDKTFKYEVPIEEAEEKVRDLIDKLMT